VLVQRAAFDQRTEMLFERIAAGPGQLDGLANGHAAVLAGELDDLQLQFRHGRQHDPLALDFLLQSPRLLGQAAEEEHQPRLPVRRLRAYLEHDSDLLAVLVEGGDAVRVGLVVAPMPDVLVAVAHQPICLKSTGTRSSFGRIASGV